ncbi:MAG: hypothetical protein ACFFCI_05050 [Promethearchaeota archaeon]
MQRLTTSGQWHIKVAYLWNLSQEIQRNDGYFIDYLVALLLLHDIIDTFFP